MNLIHYTNEKFSLERREYDQNELNWHAKPNGLWVSVEGKCDWKWWCNAESFNLENLAVSYELKLKEDANILYLSTADDIRDFSKLYHLSTRSLDSEYDSYQINWNKVKQKYQGIIISTYQWDCRLAHDTYWYYGWDCACGCIWDLDCIEEFELIENSKVYQIMTY